GPGSADATLLLMPAWTRGLSSGGGGRIGVKVVSVFPDNGRRSLPSIFGQYLLLDGDTGAPLALLDGTMLTKRRTACASGLASRYLSRPDAARLLMIGTGALAPHRFAFTRRSGRSRTLRSGAADLKRHNDLRMNFHLPCQQRWDAPSRCALWPIGNRRCATPTSFRAPRCQKRRSSKAHGFAPANISIWSALSLR